METTLNQDVLHKGPAVEGKKVIPAGLVTGEIAGLIMAVVVMLVFAVFLGKSPFYPVQVIGSTLYGEAALQGFHLGAFLTGLILHLAGPSLLWGFIYGLIAKKLFVHTTGAALGLGLIIGILAMVGPYILIPAVMKALQGVDYWNREVPLSWDWAAHLVYGASFVFYPRVLKALQRERPRSA